MRIYYRHNSLCGRLNGNGKKIPILKRWLYSLSSEEELHPFSLSDINAVLFNRHHSIGCSLKAPLKYVSWQNEAQWYELFEGEQVYLPKCIVFTNGIESYAIVVIGYHYELRVWHDNARVERTKPQWFSHQPVVDEKELQAITTSFRQLLCHIQRENDKEMEHPKFE